MLLFPPGSLPDGPLLDTKKALVLLDFQNDFVSPDGRLYAENTAGFLSKLPDLISRFREEGEIVWASTEFREPCSAISPETGGSCILLKQFLKDILAPHDDHSSGYPTPCTEDDASQGLSEAVNPVIELDEEAFLAPSLPKGYERCCLPTTAGTQYPDLLSNSINRTKDLVTVKTHYSAFADMSLLFQLRTRMVTHLYLCGSLSNISVYATALDSVRHGFQVTLIEDCLGYRDETCHINAVRQMADNMCVEGIDFQELMDDLAGLLGDVVKEENYHTKFEVDLSRPTLAGKRSASAQQVNEWITGVQTSAKGVSQPTGSQGSDSKVRPGSSGSEANGESFGQISARQPSPVAEYSPPRKRSTNDIDELEVSPHIRLSSQSSIRRSSHDAYARPEPRGKKTKIRVRKSLRDTQDTTKTPRPTSMQSLSTGGLPEGHWPSPAEPRSPEVDTAPPEAQYSKKHLKKSSRVFLGPGDHIGDGTSNIIHNVIGAISAKRAFDRLKSNIAWQKMYHRSGEVPRLVAVQGDMVVSTMDDSTTYPIYRHPADESPKLLPFDKTVDSLRQECEKHVGHTLNHVLIQYYRNGEDNISEHSDKTLDIVRGSHIVNLSLGAMRTMTLRMKKPGAVASPTSQDQAVDSAGIPRPTQRIRLPHSSLFILSCSTNAKYLHAVRADRRADNEKCEEELAFGGERISLTFRHVGTYITEIRDGRHLIWGQGATGKRRGEAKEVSNPATAVRPDLYNEKLAAGSPTSAAGEADHDISPTNNTANINLRQVTSVTVKSEAELQGEKMITAFGKENHEGEDFDWDRVYGSGFDIVSFVTKLPVPG